MLAETIQHPYYIISIRIILTLKKSASLASIPECGSVEDVLGTAESPFPYSAASLYCSSSAKNTKKRKREKRSLYRN